MSDPVQYVLAMDGVDHPVSDVTIETTSFDVPKDASGFLISFVTPDILNLGADATSFTITELDGGSEVGSISARDVVTSYSSNLGHQFVLGSVYSDEAIALDFSVSGEFDQCQPCFLAGTHIATDQGYRNVETLKRGDVALLANGELSEIKWVGSRRQASGHVVRVRKDALGRNIPVRDLVISDDHALFLDGALIPAGLLVNDISIVRDPVSSVSLYHVELERHEILLAEDAPVESYLDTGNRRQFGNCLLAYDPAEVAAAKKPYAEVVFSGARLERIRAALAEALVT